jgi:fatty-acyl-CoA synthase
MPGIQLKVIDPVTDQELPPATPGELCVRGYSVMMGYYNKPEETANAIDEEGWFHTGDMAMMTPEGYVKFMGRFKDMLKVGGENVDPMEVEAYLQEYPKVSTASIIGVPDDRLNEVPMTYIKLREGVSCSEEEILQFCRGKIASFKIPRYVKFVEEFPMTSSGKIQKFKLREEAAEFLKK